MESIIIKPVVDYYNWLMTDMRDPRVDSYPLMSSPLPTLLICLTYALIVKKLGPAFMANREAFQLRTPIIVYNGIQVLFSTWLFYEYGRGGWFHGYSFKCQPVDYGYSEMALRMVHVCWWYYFSKFTEFFDTFFFILRKKNNHVSPLHVIHHGIMPMSVWFGVKFTPGGHSTFFGLLNTFVHIVMYFYYMLAAFGPQMQKYLWWKKYLTTLQIIQFIGIAGHSFQLLFVECKYPKAFVWWIGCHGLLFLVLFSKFYRVTYLANQEKRRKAKQAAAEYAAAKKDDHKSNGANGSNGSNGNGIHMSEKATKSNGNGNHANHHHHDNDDDNNNIAAMNGNGNGRTTNGGLIKKLTNGNSKNGNMNGNGHHHNGNGTNGTANGGSGGGGSGDNNSVLTHRHNNTQQHNNSNGSSNGNNHHHSNGNSNGTSNGSSKSNGSNGSSRRIVQ